MFVINHWLLVPLTKNKGQIDDSIGKPVTETVKYRISSESKRLLLLHSVYSINGNLTLSIRATTTSRTRKIPVENFSLVFKRDRRKLWL